MKELGCLWTYEKSDEEQVRLSVFEAGERKSRHLSLRQWWRDDSGKWWPTKRGCCLPLGALAELQQALRQAEEYQPADVDA